MIPSPIRQAAQSKESYGDIVPPLSGINTYDPINGLKQTDALRLENYVCRPDGLHVRRGKQLVMSEIGAAVVSLFGHGVKVFSATETAIMDGRIPVVSGLTSGRWSFDTITNPAGAFLWMCNGADNPQVFSGSAWSAPAITGVDATTLEFCCRHQHRIFASVKNSLTVAYLEHRAIAGPACLFRLEALCERGGFIAGIASMTGNASKDRGDQLVIVTTNGEVVIYAGDDPDHAESWSLSGVFKGAKPVPGKCLTQVGGRLMLLTVKGLVSVPDLITAAEKDREPNSPSKRINKSLKIDNGLRLREQYWSVVESASNNLLMIHAPSELQTRGYVQASETSAWSTFSELGATCWLEHDGRLLFGTADGKIYQLAGYDDDGAAINSFMVGAYEKFGTAQRKLFSRTKLIWDRPLGYYRPRVELLTDYREPPDTFAAAYQAERYRQWGSIDWPDTPISWDVANGTREGRWRGVRGRGGCAALMIGMRTRAPIVMQGGQIMFEMGGGI